jgi:hypothetical protein
LPASYSRPPANRDEAPRTLATLEHWFQGQIVRPHEARALGNAARAERAAQAERAQRTLASASANAADAREWILPSKHLRPKERVDIYSRMYFSRLLECMQVDYPALAKIAGEKTFDKLVRAYLLQHPSRHYSLNVLGARLPQFLAGPVRVPRRALLHDVAELEQLMTVVFDAPQSNVLKPSDLAGISPQAWESARPRLVDALRLAAFEHRANAIVTAARQDQTLPDLGRAKTWVAVYRKDYVVWRMDLSEPMYAVLRALEARATLREALEAGAKLFTGTADELQKNVFSWFSEWVGEGFFSAIE